MNNVLFYLLSLILKSQQNTIELVTGPGTSHPLCSGEVARLLLDWRRSPEFPCPITTARRILPPPTTAMFLIKISTSLRNRGKCQSLGGQTSGLTEDGLAVCHPTFCRNLLQGIHELCILHCQDLFRISIVVGCISRYVKDWLFFQIWLHFHLTHSGFLQKTLVQETRLEFRKI